MKYFVSNAYRKKLTDVCGSTEKTMPGVKYIALGNGSVDDDGNMVELTGSETDLRNELLRKEIELAERDGDLRLAYSYNVKVDELVDCKINEMAVYDEDGDIVAMKVFESRDKKPGMEMTFRMTISN